MMIMLFLSVGFCSSISIDKLVSRPGKARLQKKPTKPIKQSPDLGDIASLVGATLMKDTGLADSPMLQMLPGVVKMLPQLLSSELGQNMISTALQGKVSSVIGPLLSQVLSPDVANSEFLSEITQMAGGDRIGYAVRHLEEIAGPSFNKIMTLANEVGTSLLSTTNGMVSGSVAVGLGLTVLSYIIQYVGVLFGTEINLIDAIRGGIGVPDSPDSPVLHINILNALDKYD